MEEKNKAILQKALQALPELEPHAALWARLEKSLDFEDALQNTITALPEIEPSEDSWLFLEQKLTKETGAMRQRKMRSLVYYWLSAAACITLCIIGWITVQNPSADKLTLTYSQEVVEAEPVWHSIREEESLEEAITFIQASCAQELAVCHTSQFKELKSQLDELAAEMEKIQQEKALYGQDPELMKAQIKLENLQADITKELIQLILT
jgi:hypothetical protein